jgi:hypothetical protein
MYKPGSPKRYVKHAVRSGLVAAGVAAIVAVGAMPAALAAAGPTGRASIASPSRAEAGTGLSEFAPRTTGPAASSRPRRPARPVTAAPAAVKTTFHVTRFNDPGPPFTCQPGNCSLRAAVVNAQNNPGSTTIVLKAGTYHLTIPATSSTDPGPSEGDLDLSNISGDPNAALYIKGPKKGLATIDAGGASTGDRVFEIDGQHPYRDVIMNHLEVTNGFASIDTSTNESFGGGIYVDPGGTLAFYNGVVDQNQTNPSVIGIGGGVYNGGQLFMSHAKVAHNVAQSPSFAGGIFTNTNASTQVLSSTVSSNSGSFGGGFAFFAGALLSVQSSTVSNNDSGLGGAVYGGGSGATVEIQNSTLWGNTAEFGSAIRLRNGSTIDLWSDTISRNQSNSTTGGGEAGALAIQADTVATNINMANTILAGNIDNGADNIPDCQTVNNGATATLTSKGYNLIGNDNGCAGLTTSTGDQVGTFTNPIPPRLHALANNGGPTKTGALQLTSTAINRGNPGVPGSGDDTCPAVDQRGVPRNRCDIGAYELGYLTSGSCSGGHPWTLILDYGKPVIVATYELMHLKTGTRWHVTMKDNGAPFYSATKTVGKKRAITAQKGTSNRSGTDHFSVTATNSATGVSCHASGKTP